jgi:hypothetical protein
METLKSDFTEVETAAERLRTATSFADVAAFVNDMLVPFMKNHLDESVGMDDAICDLVENAEDILQPETAKVFVAAISGAKVIADELRGRLTGSEGDQKLKLVIDEFDSNAKEAMGILEEITLPEDPDEAENDNEDDDELADGDDDDQGAE